MKDIIIKRDKSGTARLTTESSQSHYGIPVLSVEADDVSGYFGPADMVGAAHAADIVIGWLRSARLTTDELQDVRNYLRQWPDGPQVWPGKAIECLRRKLGLTQAQADKMMAEPIGQSHWSEIEGGSWNPTVKMLEKFARALKCQVRDML